MTCCPLGSLLIRAWMTWNSGLGSGAAASSALQNNANKVTSCLTWLKKKTGCFILSHSPFSRCIWRRVLTEAAVASRPSGDSSPACPGSWLGWCGRRPPGSWRAEQAAAGTHHGPETSWCSPGKQSTCRRQDCKTPNRDERCYIIKVLMRCRWHNSSAKDENFPQWAWVWWFVGQKRFKLA